MPAISLTFVAFSLIVVALILLGVELFLPTHGILSLVAALVAIAGVVVGYIASPALGILLCILVVIAAPFAVFWAIKLYPKTPVEVVGYIASPALGILLCILVVIAAPFAVFWAIKLYPKTPVGKRVMLGRPDPTITDPQTQSFADLIGKRGITVTLLRPAGSVEIEGRRIDCVSDSELIQPGTPVEVVRVAGRKVTVQRII